MKKILAKKLDFSIPIVFDGDHKLIIELICASYRS